jgi:hypothetical protein
LDLEELLPIRFTTRVTAFVFVSLFSLLSAGQANPSTEQRSPDNAPAPSQPAPQPPGNQEKKAEDAGDKNKEKDKVPATPPGSSDKASTSSSGTSKDRLFYALPNFLTLENGGKAPPLTAKQKYAVVARGTFDPVQYPWWGILAAISQAQNSDPAYGQGWAAYGQRYGTQAADSTIENFLTGAVFPSILHQDPRFFQSSTGGFGRRTWYAVSRIVVTRSDSGQPQFNASEVFGSALGAAISTYSYHPRSTFVSTPTNPHMFISSERTLGSAADVWATQVGLDAITIVVKEFWPDIHRKLSHKPKGK